MDFLDRIPTFVKTLVGFEEKLTTEEFNKKEVVSILDATSMKNEARPLGIELKSESRTTQGDKAEMGFVLLYWEDSMQKVAELKYDSFGKAAQIYDKLRQQMMDLGNKTAEAFKSGKPEDLEPVAAEVSKFIKSLELLAPAVPTTTSASTLKVAGVGTIYIGGSSIRPSLEFKTEYIISIAGNITDKSLDRKADLAYITSSRNHFGKDNYTIGYWYPENVVEISKDNTDFKVTSTVDSVDTFYKICITLTPTAEQFGFYWDGKTQSLVRRAEKLSPAFLERINELKADAEKKYKKMNVIPSAQDIYDFVCEGIEEDMGPGMGNEFGFLTFEDEQEIKEALGYSDEDLDDVRASKKVVANVPHIIDFRFFEGKATFDKTTEEYKALDKMTGQAEWEDYLDLMARYGVTVEYDTVSDSFVVSNDTGQDKEESVEVSQVEKLSMLDETLANISNKVAEDIFMKPDWNEFILKSKSDALKKLNNPTEDDIIDYVTKAFEKMSGIELTEEMIDSIEHTLYPEGVGIEKKEAAGFGGDTGNDADMNVVQIKGTDLEDRALEIANEEIEGLKADESADTFQLANLVIDKLQEENPGQEYDQREIVQILDDNDLNPRASKKEAINKTSGTELWVTPEQEKTYWLLDTVTMSKVGPDFDSQERAIQWAVKNNRWSEEGAARAREKVDGTGYPEDLQSSASKKEAKIDEEVVYNFIDTLEDKMNEGATDETLIGLIAKTFKLNNQEAKKYFDDYYTKFASKKEADYAREEYKGFELEILTEPDRPCTIFTKDGTKWGVAVNDEEAKKMIDKSMKEAEVEKESRNEQKYKEWFNENKTSLKTDYKEYVGEAKSAGYEKPDSFESFCRNTFDSLVESGDIQASKKEAAEPEAPKVEDEVPATKLHPYKKRPETQPEVPVPSAPTPEMQETYGKIAAAQKKLTALDSMIADIKAKMTAEITRIEDEGEKASAQSSIQANVEKLATLIENAKINVLNIDDTYLALVDKTEKVPFNPPYAALLKWKLDKLLEHFDGASEYLENALNGAQSMASEKRTRELVTWPKRDKKSSVEKTSGLSETFDSMITSLESFVKETGNIALGLGKLIV